MEKWGEISMEENKGVLDGLCWSFSVLVSWSSSRSLRRIIYCWSAYRRMVVIMAIKPMQVNMQ